MLISLNELKKLVEINIPDDELFKLIGSRLVEIESVEDLAPKYKKIYVVKVKSAEPIEGTHLHLCQIDAGKELNTEIDPEHDGYIQVVCGAPNVKKGMLAAWIAPGATVPSTYGTNEPFEISARPLRGFMSHGMLAAADELALGEDHAGIIELDPELTKPGDLLANVLDLNDKIIEVENKSLTHRPDCFGLIGFAREIAGVLGQEYKESFAINSSMGCRNAELVDIEITDPTICPRYACATYDFSQLEKQRSPYLTPADVFLVKAGMKPISPIVDATNRCMLITGQPYHAFDYDKFVKVAGTDKPLIRVRLARNDEKLVLLDDKEIILNENDIVICSGDTPVALAGAMGGKSTAIDDSTEKIIIECATFSLYNLRKTQMAHGIFSEAITRFTKGQPAQGIDDAMRAISLELVADPITIADCFPEKPAPITIDITTEEINALLGSNYSEELIIKTLRNTSFEVKKSAHNLAVTAPHGRTDIHIKEDIIEEVGRLLGFDNLPLVFPYRPFVCPSYDPLLDLKSRLRTILSDRLGCNELLTYSFVSKALQEKANEDPEESYQIINSISPELECFRQSLLPSLLDKARDNEKAGYEEFTLYELNQVAKKSWGLNEENVPVMQTELGLVTFGDYYQVKYILGELGRALDISFEIRPIDSSNILEPLHAGSIYLGDKHIGEFGEVKSSVLRKFKLAPTISALSLNLEPCLSAEKHRKTSVKLSKFPFVSRDITLRVKENVQFADVESSIKAVLSQISDIIYILEPVSIFKKPTDDQKNLSFHLEVANETKTLDSHEISDIIDIITNNLKALGAEVV